MQIVCAACGVKNRVPAERLHERPKCGKCAAALLPAAPVALSDATFERFVQNTELPVLVDFWAGWCGPCKMMAPIFAQVAREFPQVHFVKIDTESAPQTAGRYRIQSIPTLLLLRGGRELARSSGALPAAQLAAWLRSKLAA